MHGLVILFLSFFLLGTSHGHWSFALWNYNGLISCETGVVGWRYQEYGCWCNVYLKGYGSPVDEIDDCCMMHTVCYDSILSDEQCRDAESLYTVVYGWSCPNHVAHCSNTNSACGQALCTCDVEAAHCFKRHLPFPATAKPCE